MHAILLNRHSPTVQRERVCLWEKGIEACGDTWEYQMDAPNDQFADVSIGWGIYQQQQAQRWAYHRVILECGFLGDRTENLFVGIAGLNGSGALPGPVISGRGAQWYGDLRERKPREHRRVIVLGQVPSDTNLHAFHGSAETQINAYARWLASMCAQLASRGAEVGFRAHPRDPANRDMLVSMIPFAHDFDKLGWSKEEIFEWADVALAFNSNGLVEAFMAGLDIMPAHPGSMCWDVRSNFGAPRHFTASEKQRWLDKVASYQWNHEEIANGAAWRYIVSNL